MNIFVLDTNVVKCAQYHCDKHCVKMILESTQLLNNACIINDTKYVPVYRPTHLKHPCSIWAASSRNNFKWLVKLSLELCYEYTFRYNKTHKCQPLIEELNTFNKIIPEGEQTPHVLCMPNKYKVDDPVQSYRNYYIGDKFSIAHWKNRSPPSWWG